MNYTKENIIGLSIIAGDTTYIIIKSTKNADFALKHQEQIFEYSYTLEYFISNVKKGRWTILKKNYISPEIY